MRIVLFEVGRFKKLIFSQVNTGTLKQSNLAFHDISIFKFKTLLNEAKFVMDETDEAKIAS